MRRRVVIDTNVIVAALRSGRGASAAVLRAAAMGEFDFCLSVALLVEYESVVKRPATGIHLPMEAIDDILDYLAQAGHHESIYFLWRPLLPDPADDLVLEVAVAGSCDAIVTHNGRDFQGAERFGLGVLTPAEFLYQLRRNPE